MLTQLKTPSIQLKDRLDLFILMHIYVTLNEPSVLDQFVKLNVS